MPSRPPSETYIIRGGRPGRERLRVLARVVAPTTTALLDRLDVADHLLAALHRIAADDHTVDSLPRIVQAWGRRA